MHSEQRGVTCPSVLPTLSRGLGNTAQTRSHPLTSHLTTGKVTGQITQKPAQRCLLRCEERHRWSKYHRITSAQIGISPKFKQELAKESYLANKEKLKSQDRTMIIIPEFYTHFLIYASHLNYTESQSVSMSQYRPVSLNDLRCCQNLKYVDNF